MTYTTAIQWREAATAAFTRTLADLLGITRKSDLSVTLHSHPNTAAVSWNTSGGKTAVALYLPAMRPGAKLTRQDADALAGYWVHEAAHVLFTDRAAWDAACARSQAFRRMVNGLEDIRIERELLKAQKVPGAETVLHAIVERAVWNAPTTPEAVNTRANAPALFAYLGRAVCNGFDLTRAPAIRNALTPENRALAARVFARVEEAQSTADIVAIVDDLFRGGNVRDPQDGDAPQDLPEMDGDAFDQDPEDMADLADDQPTPGADDEQHQPGDKSDEDGDGQGQSGDDTDEADEADEEGQATDGEAGAAEATDGEATDAAGDPDAGREGDFRQLSDRDDLVDADPSAGVEEIADDINGEPLSWRERDLIENADMRTPRIRPETTACNGKTGAEIFADVDGIGALKAAVRRLVRAPERFGWQRHLERGRLDPKGLARARLGHRDVYARADRQEGHTAAVSLILDMSGSMGWNAVPQAAMAYHVADAVEGAGAPVMVRAFTGGDNLRTVKGWKDRVRASRDHFTGAAYSPGSNTPLSRAIHTAAKDLATGTDATVKILFAMTDGGDDYGADHVRAAIRLARDLGVVVVGVVIRRSGTPDGYGFDAADAAVVTPADQLGGTVLKELVDTLERSTKGRKARAA